MKYVFAVPIFASLTIILLAVIPQQVTMALYFLPLNNTIINQEGENMTNQTPTAIPTPPHVSNQTPHVSNQTTTTPPPTPLHESNQTPHVSNQTTTTPPTTPLHVSNQTTAALPNPSLNNQTTTTAAPLPLPLNNQTTTTPPTTPLHVSNQTTATAATNNPSFLSYTDPTFNFKISYPSNLTRYGVLNLNLHKITNIGHESLGEVAFGLPNNNKTFFAISIGRDSGNFLLKDYAIEETNMLSKYVGFKSLESSDISLYVYGIVKNGVEVNQGKSMEIITMHNTWPIFIEFRGSLSDYQKYLPIAQRIIDSFQFVN
jgi:hypothetical protein